MASEVGRKDYGMTEKGQVVVIETVTFGDNGEVLPSMFSLRHGVREVMVSANEKAVAAAAKAIAEA